MTDSLTVVVPCRVCLLESSINIYDATFDTEDGEVRIAEAFEYFSSLLDESHDPAKMLCYECTNQLIAAYQFLIRVKRSDERIAKQLHQRDDVEKSVDKHTSDEPLFKVICVKSESNYSDAITFSPESPAKTADEDNIGSPFAVPDELLQTDDVSEFEHCIVVSPHTQTSSPTTEPTTSHLKPKTSQQIRQDVAAVREAKRRRAIEANESAGKRIHLSEKPFILDQLLIPQFVITDVSTSPTNQVKNLEIDVVRISVAELQTLSFSDVPINELEHPASPTSMFACKYCPKAFATCHHLNVHTRKSHVCQFCLKGFVGVADLNEHTQTKHAYFECPMCAKDFHCNSNLRTHLKRGHGIALPANVSLLTLDQIDSSDVRLIEI